VHRRSPCFLLAPRPACHRPSCFLLACASPAHHAPARLRIAGHRACFSPSTSLAIVLPAHLRIAGPPCSCSPAHRQPPCLLLAQHIPARRRLCSCSPSSSPVIVLLLDQCVACRHACFSLSTSQRVASHHASCSPRASSAVLLFAQLVAGRRAPWINSTYDLVIIPGIHGKFV
jgi:hypothetical protein